MVQVLAMKKFNKKITTEILYYSIWFGLVTGVVEGIVLYTLQRFELLRGQITYLGSSWEVLWLAPIFDLLLFLIVGIFLALLAGFLPQVFAKRLALFAFSFMMVFPWILSYLSGRLSPIATGILAAGIGYQLSNFLYGREIKFAPFVQRTTKGFVVLTLALFVIVQGGYWITERSTVRNLPTAKNQRQMSY